MELENIVINTVKEIHTRKKKADLDSIITNIKDLTPEIIEETLRSLCQKDVLCIVERQRVESYRFVKNVEVAEEEKETESVSEEAAANRILDDVIVVNSVNMDGCECLLDEEIKSFGLFNNFKSLTTQVSDLKEYISYKLNMIRSDSSNLLIDRLKDEINFLKEEIKDYRKLINEILENQRQNQSIRTKKDFEQIKNSNEWNAVSTGPPRVVINNGNNDKEFYHNRFNDLVIEDYDDNSEQNGKNQNFTCAKGSQNNNDLYVKNHTRSSNNVTQRRRPDPVINMYPERDRLPSKSDYPKVNQTKKIRIMSDCITKGIRVKEFNSYLQNGNSRFKIFPGASVEKLDYYVNPTLEQERPEIVVIHVGINNLLSDHLSEMSDEDISKQILDIGKKCKRYGVDKVFISALVISRRVNPNRIENLNKLIKEGCNLDHVSTIPDRNRSETFRNEKCIG